MINVITTEEQGVALALSIEDQDEIQAEKRLVLQHQTEQALAQEINASYVEYTALTADVFNLALKIENGRIKLGTLLITAKSTVGHGKFMDWLEANCAEISDRSARNYMAWAKVADCKPIESLDGLREYTKLLIRLGLREPNVGHGAQQLHDFNGFAVLTKSICGIRAKINEVFEKEPLDEWEDDAREQLKDQLQPLVELYEELA